MTASQRLANTSWTDLNGDEVLLVPLGSVEQHGPHLPLSTDALIAEAVCLGLSALDANYVITPVIHFGASGEHRSFRGTISIGTEVLRDVLIELGRSCDWAAGVVFVNAHGGNAQALIEAVHLLSAEGRSALAVPCAVRHGDAHAGHVETSVLLHIAGDRVDMSRAEPGNTSRWEELSRQVRDEGVAAVSPNGVLGDPTLATADDGKEYLEAMVSRAHRLICRWKEQR